MKLTPSLVILLAAGSTVLARPQPTPATPEAPAAPSLAMPAITSTDADVVALTKLLTGSFKAPAAGSQPDLTLHIAVISVEGLDNALYFEVNRADTPQKAFSQGVFHAFHQRTRDGRDEFRLRVFSFDKLGHGFGESAVGLWLAPEAFAPLRADQLLPAFDLVLQKKGEGFAGSSGATPVNRDGATLLLSAMDINPQGVRIAEQGLKPDGSEAFGPSGGDAAGAGLLFTRAETGLRAVRHAGGLFTIDLVTGEGVEAADGDDLAFQYTGWIRADGFQFDSSRQEGRQPLQFSLPAQLIQGWNVGIVGIKKGGTRRLIIPPGMAYGESGRRQARIPGNAWLVFEAECVYLKDNPPPPPPPPPAPPADVPATGAPNK